MTHRHYFASSLTRSDSLDCRRQCFAVHQAASGRGVSDIAAGDAAVAGVVDRFVRGSEAEVLDRGTRLLRRVIETGMRQPASCSSTWFVTVSRMQRLAPAFATARRIIEFRKSGLDALRPDLGDARCQSEVDAAAADFRTAYPEHQQEAVRHRAAAGGVLRSVDWQAWIAAHLAQLHREPQLRALAALCDQADFATALACMQRGLQAGFAAAEAGELSTHTPSPAAQRLLALFACEFTMMAGEPEVDPAAVRGVFRTFYAPEIGRLFDAAMSVERMNALAQQLGTPDVQHALRAEAVALPRVKRELTELLLVSVIEREAGDYLPSSCAAAAF